MTKASMVVELLVLQQHPQGCAGVGNSDRLWAAAAVVMQVKSLEKKVAWAADSVVEEHKVRLLENGVGLVAEEGRMGEEAQTEVRVDCSVAAGETVAALVETAP
jgi:hypothetical protein